MTIPRMTVLVVGATGSIGHLVVEEALREGHTVRALVRTPGKARRLPLKAQVVRGDVTRPDTLPGAVDGVDAVVFTLGSDGAGKVGAESIDYGGVRNVLGASGRRGESWGTQPRRLEPQSTAIGRPSITAHSALLEPTPT